MRLSPSLKLKKTILKSRLPSFVLIKPDCVDEYDPGRIWRTWTVIFWGWTDCNKRWKTAVNALLDTGSTEWLAINEQDLEAFNWSFYGTRQVKTEGETILPTYLGRISVDQREFTIPVVVDSAFQQVLMGIPWLRTRRWVVDFSDEILILGWKASPSAAESNRPRPQILWDGKNRCWF